MSRPQRQAAPRPEPVPLGDKLSPLARGGTLADAAHAHLRDLLVGGRVAPGERLSLRDMAEALGVSIMPVRDAVSRLVAAGALEVTPNRAVRVPLMTASQFRELAALRAELEGYAAGEAAAKRDAAGLAAIEAAEAAFRRECQKARPNLPRVVQLNCDLHFAIYAAAGSRLLSDVVQGLWLKAGPVLNFDLRANPKRIPPAIAVHARAVAAIRDSDAGAARDAIAGDITGAAAFILATTRFAED